MRRAWRRYLAITWDWQAALCGLRDNPLANYLDTAQRRRQAARNVFARSPQLLGCAALISALLTYLSVLSLWELYSLRQSPVISCGYALSVFGFGTAVLLAGAALYCLYWLYVCFQAASQNALGFLSRQVRRLPQGMDDMLAVTSLREPELLAGLMRHALGLLHPPLICLSLILGAFMALASQAGGSTLTQFWLPALQAPGWPAGLLIGALFTLQYYLSGLAASCILLFLQVALGFGSRSYLMPRIGSISQVFFQFCLLLIGLINLVSLADAWQYDLVDLPLTLCAAGETLAVLILLALLARRAAWLRVALAYGLPFVLAGVALIPIAFGVLYSLDFFLPDLPSYFMYATQALSLASPMLVGGVSVLDSETVSLRVWLAAQCLPWLIIATSQALLLVVFAELARDALRRRAEEAA